MYVVVVCFVCFPRMSPHILANSIRKTQSKSTLVVGCVMFVCVRLLAGGFL